VRSPVGFKCNRRTDKSALARSQNINNCVFLTQNISNNIDYPQKLHSILLDYTLSFTTYNQRFDLVDEFIEPETRKEGFQFYYLNNYNGFRSFTVRDKDPLSGQERRSEQLWELHSINSDQSVLSQIKDPNRYPEISYLSTEFSKISLYRSWQMGRDSEPRKAQKADLPQHPDILPTIAEMLIEASQRTQLIVTTHPDAFNVLLVDAEAPVNKKSPWEHLKFRDNWDKPTEVDDDNCHLMVQTMEAWFIADFATLKKFYGQGFKENAIPKNANVETIAKDNLEPTLKTATSRTTKEEYHKIKHASELLESLDVTQVRQASPYCDRLFNTLRSRIGYLQDES
jgi:hypothetical protein